MIQQAGRWAGRAGRAGRRWGVGAGALGRQARGRERASRRERARRRQAQAGRRRGRAGHWAWAHRARGVPVRAGWACWLVSWAKLVHCAHGSVLTQFLDPIRLSTIPESLNEHCSLQTKISEKKRKKNY